VTGESNRKQAQVYEVIKKIHNNKKYCIMHCATKNDEQDLHTQNRILATMDMYTPTKLNNIIIRIRYDNKWMHEEHTYIDTGIKNTNRTQVTTETRNSENNNDFTPQKESPNI
jgi:hypothetical protein